MDYVFELAIPKNTSAEYPVSESLRIPAGTITQVRIYFPAGCAALVGVRIRVDELQVYPSNPDKWYVGDDIQISFTDEFELTENFSTVVVEGYNLDDTFAHLPRVSLTELSATAFTLQKLAEWLSHESPVEV